MNTWSLIHNSWWDNNHRYSVRKNCGVLCNADYDCPIKFAFVERNNGTTVAECITTVSEITSGKTIFELQGCETPSTMEISGFVIEKDYTLVDYLQSGWQISLFIGIDYTGSNGNP